MAYRNRGRLWIYKKKEYGKGLNDFTEGLRIDPKNADLQNGLAWLRATCPDSKYRDGKKAIEGATTACKLTEWKNPNYIDTLAAAYAEDGQFNLAVKYQEMALQFPSFQESSGDNGRERIQDYKNKKPYREK